MQITDRKMDPMTVIHLIDDYLARSQTFIYQYLSKMESTHPFVITQALSNQHLFPLSDVVLIRQLPSLRWFRERLLLRTTIDFPSLSSRITKIIEKAEGSILHAHFGHVGYRSLKLKKRTGLPLLTTFYGFDMSMLPRRSSWQKAYQKLFLNGDLFLTEGPTMAQKLRQLGCPQDKILIQPIAIDLSKIQYRQRVWDGRSPMHILMAGRFVEKKGFVFAIRAFAQIAAQWPSVELRIIGDGPLYQELVAEISKFDLQSRVNLLGVLDYDAYLAEADNAHLFISPSVTAQNGDTEGGAPTTILEMQAAGLPILATYHADIPHIVKDGESALLVSERDVVGLANKLDWLLTNHPKWIDMGRIGCEYVLQMHNIDIEASRLENIYFNLISKKTLA